MISGMELYNIIVNQLKNGISEDSEWRDVLRRSLFYYCSGCDPTPVLVFEGKWKIYIYSDIIIQGTFDEEFNKLCNYIAGEGFSLLKKENVNNPKWERCILSLWTDSKGRDFCLAFIKHDAVDLYKDIYLGIEKTIPVCITNINYEFYDSPNYSSRFFNNIKSLYVLGYCFDSEYECIDEYNYYNTNEKVQLFRKNLEIV